MVWWYGLVWWYLCVLGKAQKKIANLDTISDRVLAYRVTIFPPHNPRCAAITSSNDYQFEHLGRDS